MQEEPVMLEKTMKCVKLNQSHEDKMVFNNANTEVQREVLRIQCQH